MNIDELERLAKLATPGPWKASITGMVGTDDNDCRVITDCCSVHDADFIAAANPETMLALIAELREYRHLCAQVRAVYDSDSGCGDGMVSMCYRNSQRRGAQVVEAVLQWQQRADESADLRKGIQGDMT